MEVPTNPLSDEELESTMDVVSMQEMTLATLAL